MTNDVLPDRDISEFAEAQEIDIDALARIAVAMAYENGDDDIDVADPAVHAREHYESYAFHTAEMLLRDHADHWVRADPGYSVDELRDAVVDHLEDSDVLDEVIDSFAPHDTDDW